MYAALRPRLSLVLSGRLSIWGQSSTRRIWCHIQEDCHCRYWYTRTEFRGRQLCHTESVKENAMHTHTRRERASLSSIHCLLWMWKLTSVLVVRRRPCAWRIHHIQKNFSPCVRVLERKIHTRNEERDALERVCSIHNSSTHSVRYAHTYFRDYVVKDTTQLNMIFFGEKWISSLRCWLISRETNFIHSGRFDTSLTGSTQVQSWTEIFTPQMAKITNLCDDTNANAILSHFQIDNFRSFRSHQCQRTRKSETKLGSNSISDLLRHNYIDSLEEETRKMRVEKQNK